jgi:hypothetical protein
VRKSNRGTSQNKKRSVQIRLPVLWTRQMESPPRGKTGHRLAGRMHGGASTGARTAEGLLRSRSRRRKYGMYSAELRPKQNCSYRFRLAWQDQEKSVCAIPRRLRLGPSGKLWASWQKVEPVLLLFNRAFYPNLVRATIAGNGVTMAGSFLARFSHKGWLPFPFGDRGLGPLGDVVFNTCWVSL